MASPSSSSSSSRRLSPSPRSPVFTPIQELEKETEEEEEEPETKQAQSSSSSSAAADAFPYKHEPTPLHQKKSINTPNNSNYNSSISVLCNKCRPSSRDKISVVPFDSSKSPSNPKAILHSLLFSLTRGGKSPKPTPTPSSSSSTSTSNLGTDDSRYWKMTAAELSRKLIHATRKRDEALVESSRLRNSVADLESKLNRLESYCLELKSSLDSHLLRRSPAPTTGPTVAFAAESTFLSSVSLARSAVRNLARSYRAAAGGSPLVHVEASLNRVFYGDMEKIDESKTLDPAGRCEQNLAAYESVRGITWEDVLTKGTRHYSEGLSRFCDRKMSEVVGTLGWARAWPESLLQAFFSAAKGVWMVGLLARSVHPAVPLLGVEGGARFDKDYMEDAVAGERVRRLTPVSVRMVVAPGFYVGAGVVKCKVLCAYSNNSEGDSNMS